MSLFTRNISREISEGLEDEKGAHAGEFPSATWRSKPDGRGHIDTTGRDKGTDTVSPVIIDIIKLNYNNYLIIVDASKIIT